MIAASPPVVEPTARPFALGANGLTAITSILLATLYSLSFWEHLAAADLPPGLRGGLFLVASGLLFAALNAVLLSLVAWRRVQKPALAVILVLSALAAYFMDAYGAVLDRHALQSVLETDVREGSEWLSGPMLAYVLGLGVLPAGLLALVPVRYRSVPRELRARALFVLGAFGLVALAILPFTQEMASTARNHGELRHLATPTNLVNAVRAYVKHAGPARPEHVAGLGLDAHGGSRPAGGKPRLLVLVVGESARAASFSLGGYARQTNPGLGALDVTYFSDVTSCGTNTATSLPCMFSNLGRRGYDESDAAGSENLLDVIRHGGFEVEWEDNNTGSKGIARRVREEDMHTPPSSGMCDAEGCLDGILVDHLRAELTSNDRDKVYVLHQIGSHGPAYFKRYPEQFARFRPTCDSVALQACTKQQIRNSYDNTILYTDHVLSSLVKLLQESAGTHASALLYVSDHSESTGERGLYLHGAPFMFAPGEQTRIPMLLWTSPDFRRWRGLDPACVDAARARPLSHDNLFHTVLGLLDLQTAGYQPGLDALAGCAPA